MVLDSIKYKYVAFRPVCAWCTEIANYEAEAIDGRSVLICSLYKHDLKLTGSHRLLKETDPDPMPTRTGEIEWISKPKDRKMVEVCEEDILNLRNAIESLYKLNSYYKKDRINDELLEIFTIKSIIDQFEKER